MQPINIMRWLARLFGCSSPWCCCCCRDHSQVSRALQEHLEIQLCIASAYDNINRVRELVEVKGVNVNCVQLTYCMPLHFAVMTMRRTTQVAQFLLEHGASVDADLGNGRLGEVSPLAEAIVRRRVDMVNLLLRFGANTVTVRHDDKTYTALYLACWKGTLEIVRHLLDHHHDDGLDVNAFIEPRAYDGPAMSPLCWACKKNDLEMAQLLIMKGAQVIHDGRTYPDGPSPLVHAVKCNKYKPLELVCILLEHVDRRLLVQEWDGPHPLTPPLYVAIRFDLVEAVQLMINHGANISDQPFLWHCAKKATMRKLRLESTRVLLRAGANVNLPDPESGETPLWVAAKNGHLELVRDFLKAGANVSTRANNGETPLGVAYRQGHKGTVYLLLRTSPNVWSTLEEVLSV